MRIQRYPGWCVICGFDHFEEWKATRGKPETVAHWAWLTKHHTVVDCGLLCVGDPGCLQRWERREMRGELSLSDWPLDWCVGAELREGISDLQHGSIALLCGLLYDFSWPKEQAMKLAEFAWGTSQLKPKSNAMPETKTTVSTAKRLRELIDRFGDTEAGFAKRIGVSRSLINRVLRGERGAESASPTIALKAFTLLGVRPDYWEAR